MEGACGCAFIQVDSSSENCIVLYSGTNKRQSREHIDQVLESFEEGDLLILQNEINELPYLIDRAYECGMRIVLNPSPYNSQVEESDLNKIEFFLLNEVKASRFPEAENRKKILSYMKRRFPEAKVVLTLGSQGAVYQDSRQKICQPPFRRRRWILQLPEIPLPDILSTGSPVRILSEKVWNPRRKPQPLPCPEKELPIPSPGPGKWKLSEV